MRHQIVLTRFREALAQLTVETDSAVRMAQLDIAHISENLFCELLRTLYDWHCLRNLNADERPNFPAIDLADDSARLAVQITASPAFDKIRNTLVKFTRHGLHKRYDRLVIYVLSRRQDKYSQSNIDALTNGRFSFDAQRDILDYRSLAARAATLPPRRAAKALEVLVEYTRGVPAGFADEDFDPPAQPAETLRTNLVRVSFPTTLYVAEILPDVLSRGTRKALRDSLAHVGVKIPSDFEVRSRSLLTFRGLHDERGPFRSAIDPGTITPILPQEYYAVDEDRERTFKSLLRLVLQQRLYRHGVVWKHKENLFVFYPRRAGDSKRTERWTGARRSAVTVFHRKMKKKLPDEVLSCKHLAFRPQFVCIDNRWYLSITPDWYFSHGEDFCRSAFADERLTSIKKLEREQTIRNRFRFWCHGS